MKKIVIIHVVLCCSWQVFGQKVDEDNRKSVYDSYIAISKVYLKDLKQTPNSTSDFNQFQLSYAESKMMEVHLQAFLDHFEKRLRRKDTRSLSRFIEQLNKHLREGYRGIYGYKLPEEFFTATEKALADGSLYPQSKR